MDYEIDSISDDEYELKIFLKTSDNAFNSLLKKNISKVQRKLGGVKKVDFDSWAGDKEFIVLPKIYFNLLATALKKSVKKIKLQLLADKVELVSGRIVDAYYQRKSEDNLWIINVIIRGGYKDVKRSRN